MLELTLEHIYLDGQTTCPKPIRDVCFWELKHEMRRLVKAGTQQA